MISAPVNVIKIQFQLVLIFAFNTILKLLPFHLIRITYLRLLTSKIGYGTAVHSGIYFTRPGNLSVGNFCTLNKDCYIDTRGGVTIGDCVMIGHRTRIYTAGHVIDSELFDGFESGVRIEDYAVIFPNSQIMPGVTIGKGAVVLTGSVVTRNVEEFTVVGGNPSTYIRHRSTNINYKHNYKFWLANV
jgi:acetyltransferase-like isoleucine patch superfamily enzyme